jgi:hypothetical protein
MKLRIKDPEIPVAYKTEVLVIGAGPAGFAAAVTAARNGAKTMLVERGGYAGGMWTLGLLCPYFDNDNKGGLNKELKKKLKAVNSWGGLWDISFDRCQMIMALDEMLLGAGVDMLLYSIALEPVMDGDRMKGVIVATKSGLQAVTADIVIDCSGDGDIAAAAGADFKIGRDSDGLAQPMTMMFKIGGLKEDYPKDDIIGWYKVMISRIEEKTLLEKIPYNYPAIVKLPRKGEALIQWTHVKYKCGADANDLTSSTLEARKQIRAALEALKSIKDVIGDVYLLDLPEIIGVRDTRRIKGDYTICDEDVESGFRFEDSICKVNFGIDIHEPGEEEQTVIKHDGFYIPYRSLLPFGFDNLLVAGRCISGSWKAHAAYRVTGNCVAMGEAAGLAAAKAIKENISLREVSGRELSDALSFNA